MAKRTQRENVDRMVDRQREIKISFHRYEVMFLHELRLLFRRKDLIAAILILSDLLKLTPGKRTYLLSGIPEPAKPAHRNGN
jgi:hypothetical protein